MNLRDLENVLGLGRPDRPDNDNRPSRRPWSRSDTWALARFGCTVLGVVLLGMAFALADETLTGRASVSDGDTLEIQGRAVRFNGIDAPESGQQCHDEGGDAYRCGQAAAQALDEWLARSRPTTCELTGERTYDRWVGTCYRADGQSASEWLVRSGWAMDYARFSGGAYAPLQRQAESEGRGIWRGEFVPPWDWRRGIRLASADAPSPPERDCAIKGNIARDGERIYHMPGQTWYGRTGIDKAEGEQWFCSPQEAEAAGWRRALR